MFNQEISCETVARFITSYMGDRFDHLSLEETYILQALQSLDLPASEKFYPPICALKKGEFMLVRNEHDPQMLFEIRKSDDGENLLFNVYSTKQALTKHPTDKEKYDPVLSYFILLKELAHPHAQALLEWFIQSCRESEKLSEILPKIHRLGGKSFTRDHPHYVPMHRTGASAQHLLHAVLIEHFSDPDNYKRFIYHLKRYALDAYCHSAPQQALVIAGVKGLLRHLCRLSQQGTYLWDDAYRAEEFRHLSTLLNSYSLSSAPIRRVLPGVVQKPALDDTPEKTHPFLLTYWPKPFNYLSLGDAIVRRKSTVSVPHIAIPQETTDLNAALTQLIQELRHLFDLKQFDEGLTRLLQAVFIELPLPIRKIDSPPEAPYAHLNTDEKILAFFTHLQQLYLLAGLFNAGEVLQCHLLFHLLVLNAHLFSALSMCQHHSELYKKFLQKALLIFPSKNEMLHTTGMASNQPLVDQHYEHLCQLVDEQKAHSNQALDPIEVTLFKERVARSPELIRLGKYLFQEMVEIDAAKSFKLFRKRELAFLKLKNLDAAYALVHCSNVERYPKTQIFLQQADPMVRQAWATFQSECACLLSFMHLKSGLNGPISSLWPYFESAFFDTYPSFSLFPHFCEPIWNAEAPLAVRFSPLPGNGLSHCLSRKREGCGVTLQDTQNNWDSDLMLRHLYFNDDPRKFREFSLIRLVRETQLSLTLDYLSAHLELLSNHVAITYIEANLFQPGLLYRALMKQEGEAFLSQLRRVCDKGFLFYQERNALTAPGIFLVRILFLTYQYATRLDPNCHGDKLLSLYAHIQLLIQHCHDPSVKRALLKYRMLSAETCFSVCPMLLSPELNQSFLIDSLEAMFTFLSLENLETHLDKESLRQEEETKRRILTRINELPDAVIIEMFKALGPRFEMDLTSSIAHAAYPRFTFKCDTGDEIIFDLLKVTIYKNGLSQILLPKKVKSWPLVRHFGLDKATYCHQNTLDTYIQHGSVALLVQHYKDETKAQVRGLPGLTPDVWYTIFAMNKQQAETFGLNINPLLLESLPVLYKKNNPTHFILLACKSNVPTPIAILEDSQVVFTGTLNAQCTDMLFTERKTGRILCNKASSRLTYVFSHLASFYNLRVYYDPRTDIHEIELPYYEITFRGNHPSELTYLFNGESYVLQDSLNYLITPHFYQFELKNSRHEVLVILLFRSLERSPSSNEFVFSNTCYSQCPYLTIKIKDHAFIPENTLQALYLAYLYLGADQPHQAWSMLMRCDQQLGGISEHIAEARCVSWIMNLFPCPEQSHASINTAPPILICQLKALALLIRSPQNHNYHNIAIKLYEALLYFESTEDVSLPFLLSKEDRWELLDYCVPNTTASAALQLAYETLNAEMLQRELDHTMDLERQSKLLNRHYAETSDVLFNDYSIRSIDVLQSENKGFLDDSDMLDLSEASSRESPPSSLQFSFQHLDFFRQYFSFYVNIAENKKHPNHIELQEFCERYLQSVRNTLEENTEISGLFNILYRLIKSEKTGFLRQAHQCYEQELKIDERSWPYQKRRSKMKILLDISKTFSLPSLLSDTMVSNPTYMSGRNIFETLPAVSPKKVPLVCDPSLPKVTFLHDWLSEGKHRELLRHLHSQGMEEAEKEAPDHSYFAGKEYRVGQAQYRQLIHLKQLASDRFLQEECDELIGDINDYRTARLHKLYELDQAIQRLIDQVPLFRQIEIQSGMAVKLDQNTLLALYLQNDQHQYEKITALSVDQIQILHEQLVQLVENKTAIQQAEHALSLLRTLESAAMEEVPNLKFQIAQALLSQNYVDAAKAPVLSVFQLHTHFLLWKDQMDILEKLLTQQGQSNHTECVQKLRMGRGKTIAILPISAMVKANGYNLVIIEVPRALLKTCYADLRRTSTLAFNQDSFIFNFHRDSDCTSPALKRLYRKFLRAIHCRAYVVTTGSALQSLELKYFELLTQMPKKPVFSLHGPYQDKLQAYEKELTKWRDAVYYLDQILCLLKERGELIIDEVHDALWIKNKLNYTLGQLRGLDQHNVQMAISFFRFIQDKTFHLHDKPISFVGLLRGEIPLQEGDYQELCRQIADHLAHSSQGPITSILNTIDALYLNPSEREAARSHLVNYFLNEATVIPPFFAQLPDEKKELLAFYKAELSIFMRFTLSKKHTVNYGESLNPDTVIEDRLIAIPYYSNQKPKYGSHFSNEIETINYTIQSMLESGVEFELFVRFLLAWYEAARKESLIEDIPPQETLSGAAFFELTSEQFGDFDVFSQPAQERLFERLKFHPQVILNVLEAYILGNVRLEDKILHADANSHVDIVGFCQGITGTPWNSSTFHQRLSYRPDASQGQDGCIVNALQENPPQLTGLNFDNTVDFIAHLFQHAFTNKTRAIIDINATFKGIDNEEVASCLAESMSTFSKKIKFILFFDKEDRLSAMPVLDGNDKAPAIIIGQSDPKIIKQTLGSDPDELFTFYDQSHTIGADISQASYASALVLIDHTITLERLLQGVMRMRGLVEGSQRVDFVMPTVMYAEIVQSAYPVNALIDRVYENENRILRMDNFHACTDKMRNAIRHDLCKQILAIDTEQATLKHQLFSHFEPFFVETRERSFYTRFGMLTFNEDTETLLNKIAERIITSWCEVRHQAKIPVSMEQYQIMKVTLDSIMTNRGHCEPTQPVSSTTLDMQTESMKQNEVLAQKQVETQNERAPYLYYESKQAPSYHSISLSALQSNQAGSMSLNQLCSESFFDESMRVTRNFIVGFKKQKSPLDANIKFVYALCFIRREGELSCYLLTQQESSEILAQVDADPSGNVWICSIMHTVLAGHPEQNATEDPSYQRLVTQARFFNGEFNQILKQDIDHAWCFEDSAKKIAFFERVLFPHRTVDSTQMQRFRQVLCRSRNDLVELMIRSENLSFEDIKANFPDLYAKDILTALNAAKQFKDLLSAWNQTDFIQQCEQSFKKFGMYSEEMTLHLKSLITLKHLATSASSTPISPEVADIHFNLLTSLQREQGLSLEQTPFLQQAYAVNPYLSGERLDTLINASITQPSLQQALLQNRSLAAGTMVRIFEVDPTSIVKYMENLFERNDIYDPSLYEQCLRQPNLPPKYEHVFLDRLAGCAHDQKHFEFVTQHTKFDMILLRRLLKNPSCKEATIEQLLNNPKISFSGQHIVDALDNPELQLTHEQLEKMAELLIQHVRNSRFTKEDAIINNYVETFENRKTACTSRNDFLLLCRDLKTCHQQAHSPSMIFLRKKISSFRTQAWFGRRCHKKANAIEDAIKAMSLHEREKALLDEKNNLSVALAMHRYPFGSAAKPARSYHEFSLFKTNLDQRAKLSLMTPELASAVIQEYDSQKRNRFWSWTSADSRTILDCLKQYSQTGKIQSFYDLENKKPEDRLKKILAGHGLLNDEGSLNIEPFINSSQRYKPD